MCHFASIKRHRQFWIHYLHYSTQEQLMFSFVIVHSCFVWGVPPLPLQEKKEKKKRKKKRILKSACKTSSSPAELSYSSRDARQGEMHSWWQAQNETALSSKYEADQSWPHFDTGMDILGPEKNGKEKRKTTEWQGMFLKSSVFVFLAGITKRRVWYGSKTKSVLVQEGTSPILLFTLPCWQVLRVSSSSLLSFTLPPRLSELACEWFLAETAAWTNSRWAKEEAALSFIQTLLRIAAGGWCIQIPRTLTGLFSWWRP